MSVQTQIDRLAAAKTAIKSAIEGKGVAVPDATTLDGFAELVEAIEVGGGGLDLPSEITNFAVDKFTIVSDKQVATIGHSLGVVPTIAVVFRAGPVDATASSSSYTYNLPMAIVFGPAQTTIMAYASADFNGNLPYSDYSPSISKRNSQIAMTDTQFNVSMAGSGEFKAGSYVVITAKWGE